MKINNRLTITTYLNKKSPTWANLTLGETFTKDGKIAIYAKQVQEAAETIQTYLPKIKTYKIAIDLYFLVLFHELHHSLITTSTEKQADSFSLKCFKNLFGRNPIIPIKYWHKPPRIKRLTKD
jgi:hypothetical protein